MFLPNTRKHYKRFKQQTLIKFCMWWVKKRRRKKRPQPRLKSCYINSDLTKIATLNRHWSNHFVKVKSTAVTSGYVLAQRIFDVFSHMLFLHFMASLTLCPPFVPHFPVDFHSPLTHPMQTHITHYWILFLLCAVLFPITHRPLVCDLVRVLWQITTCSTLHGHDTSLCLRRMLEHSGNHSETTCEC